jgi:stress response protein YsnF
MTQMITALFDSADAANRAAHDIATRIGGVRGRVYTQADANEIAALRIPGEDQAALGENLRRGGAVLHADVPEDRFDAVCDALEAAGARDFDEAETAWRQEGWTGTQTAPRDASVAVEAAHGGGLQASGGMSDAARARAATDGEEERIPLVEERLTVGKREGRHGRVRVRTYVVEAPVQEQVTLHSERVDVERRAVDRPLHPAEVATAFQDRTIEATETSEEAVVHKEARIREELALRKVAEDRVETVSDTVRRTEVEVEDQRSDTPNPVSRDR